MAATIRRLRTHGDQRLDVQAATLRQAVLDYPRLPTHVANQVVAAIDRQQTSTNGWNFMLLGPDQNAVVVNWLLDHSRQPLKALKLWAECLRHLHWDSGEITLTRDELAEQIGVGSGEVSRIMTELDTCGAVIRRRERIAGMRGPGAVHYYVNPMVATRLSGAARDAAQAAAPALTLVDGGRST
jgi:CRP-like cAMP-binding protein